jgi:hypothetical protein
MSKMKETNPGFKLQIIIWIRKSRKYSSYLILGRALLFQPFFEMKDLKYDTYECVPNMNGITDIWLAIKRSLIVFSE